MRDLEALLDDARRHVVFHGGDGDIPSDVFDVLGALVAEVRGLQEGLQNLRELVAIRCPQSTEAPAVSRPLRMGVPAELSTTPSDDVAELKAVIVSQAREIARLKGESE